MLLGIVAVVIFSFSNLTIFANTGDMPGLIPPSACRVGAVVSGDQLAVGPPAAPGLGFSNVRIALPNDEVVAGTWAVLNNFVPDTSIIAAPNCPGALGGAIDGAGLNLMAVRINTTISSPQNADIQYVKLVWDVNANGHWDPLIDLVIQTKPGSELLKEGGALFYNGPQQPLAFLSNSTITCALGTADLGVALPQVGPGAGTNTRAGAEGCYIALLAIVKIGDSPIIRTKFGLQLKAYAGDIPGTTGVSSFNMSSGFSSSRNPQASNATVDIFGGLPGPQGPFDHINNGTGNPESTFEPLQFEGGQNGEGLLTRFRAPRIEPGTREAIMYTGALCDGGIVAVQTANILPAIAGSPPTIAGGVAAMPCIVSAGTDGLATAISSAILKIEAPPELLHLVGTVRMYADLDCDGILFETGELIQERVPFYNEPTHEMYVFFNREQNGTLFAPGGAILAGGCAAVGVPGAIDASPFPLIIIYTADINNATSAGHFGPEVAGQSSHAENGCSPAPTCELFRNYVSFGARPGESNFGGPSPPFRTIIVMPDEEDDTLPDEEPEDEEMVQFEKELLLTFFDIKTNRPFRATLKGLGEGVGDLGGGGLRIVSLNLTESHSTLGELKFESLEGIDAGSISGGTGNIGGTLTINGEVFTFSKSLFMEKLPKDPNALRLSDESLIYILDNNGNQRYQLMDARCTYRLLAEDAEATSALVVEKNKLKLIKITNTRLSNSFIFKVQARGLLKYAKIEILDLAGRGVFQSARMAGNTLRWNLRRNNDGAFVANGVYLYRVTIVGRDGEVIRSEIRKMLVMR